MLPPTAWLSILITLSGVVIFSTGRVCAGTLSEQLISAAELGEIDEVKEFLDQGVPVEASVADIFWPMIPALPIPVTTTEPRQS